MNWQRKRSHMFCLEEKRAVTEVLMSAQPAQYLEETLGNLEEKSQIIRKNNVTHLFSEWRELRKQTPIISYHKMGCSLLCSLGSSSSCQNGLDFYVISTLVPKIWEVPKPRNLKRTASLYKGSTTTWPKWVESKSWVPVWGRLPPYDSIFLKRGLDIAIW